jgi:hypothetical protein
MSKLPITSITIGLDVRDMEYGSGAGRFIHLRSDTPQGSEGIPVEDAFDQSMDMLMEAWKLVIAARYTDKSADSDTTTKALKSTSTRIEKIRTYIKEKKYESD